MCILYTYIIGRQLFGQYDMFNQYTFFDYLKQVKKSLEKVTFTDRAKPHCSKKVQEYLQNNKYYYLKIIYLPKG